MQQSPSESKGFAEKFRNSFGKSRNLDTLFKHAISIKRARDPELSRLFKKFIFSVLDGDWPAVRYRDNPTLEPLFKRGGEKFQKEYCSMRSVTYADGNQISYSDHWDDILNIATEVSASCLNPNQPSAKSNCIVSFLLDGKHRIAKISSENGPMLARTIVSIKGGCLYQGGILSGNTVLSSGHEETLRKLILDDARALNLTLLTPREFSPSPSLPLYNHDLISTGSTAPYEYAEELELVPFPNHQFSVTNGNYTLPAGNSVILYEAISEEGGKEKSSREG